VSSVQRGSHELGLHSKNIDYIQTDANINVSIFCTSVGSGGLFLFGFWSTLCKTVRPMLSDRCPSCPVYLSVTLVYGWMDQDETWRGARPHPQPQCIRWGPSSPPPKKRGIAAPPLFCPCLLWPNVWMDQDATWYHGRPWPRRHCA